MGGSTSSLRYINNDFELVIRVTKELEQTLENDHGLTNMSLSQKINGMKDKISNHILKDMSNLSKWRNKLVHDPHVNSLEDLGISRSEFLDKFERAQKELSSLRDNENKYGITRHNHARSVHASGARTNDNEGGARGLGALAFGALVVGGIALAAASSSSHPGVSCDSCGDSPLCGTRYNCLICRNIDICEECWNSRRPCCGHSAFQKRSGPFGEWSPTTWSYY